LTVVTIISQPDGSEKQVEGEDSPPLTILAHDTFPPAVPSGLQAVFSGPGQKAFVDLVWSPDAEPDLAGYYVYRREAGSTPQKLNQQPLKSPEFHDSAVASGHTYEYSVSAIDVRENESARSQPTTESVP
jgi:fibronectin type 3 domain-containing protein